MPPEKFCKITPKNTHFCAFWKQVLDNYVLTFFYFLGSEGLVMAQWPPPPYASDRDICTAYFCYLKEWASEGGQGDQ